MITIFSNRCETEPYRIFFPLGILCLLYGILLWLPQIWNPGDYPVLVHRYLMLNGFVASFMGGFLMTAVPRFSKTQTAEKWEIIFFFLLTILGIYFAAREQERMVFVISSLQAFNLIAFLMRRISKRKANPPYTFIFIFVGLLLWLISAIGGIFFEVEAFKHLHYEGSIVAIILGVGSRLIPGILGHVEIVNSQKGPDEGPESLFRTIPWYFYLIILSFVLSYFLNDFLGSIIRSVVVGIVGILYWKLLLLPKKKSALTWNLWLCGWFILLSFLLKSLWQDGLIHASHSLFLSGIVLLSLLIATRVIQSHGPKDEELENWRGLYIVSSLVVLATATRVTAFLMPEGYLRHLGYSSFVLTLAILVWSYKYLRFVRA